MIWTHIQQVAAAVEVEMVAMGAEAETVAAGAVEELDSEEAAKGLMLSERYLHPLVQRKSATTYQGLLKTNERKKTLTVSPFCMLTGSCCCACKVFAFR